MMSSDDAQLAAQIHLVCTVVSAYFLWRHLKPPKRTVPEAAADSGLAIPVLRRQPRVGEPERHAPLPLWLEVPVTPVPLKPMAPLLTPVAPMAPLLTPVAPMAPLLTPVAPMPRLLPPAFPRGLTPA